jgi:hypothetical protein
MRQVTNADISRPKTVSDLEFFKTKGRMIISGDWEIAMHHLSRSSSLFVSFKSSSSCRIPVDFINDEIYLCGMYVCTSDYVVR